jgi:cell wall-associated NlpC family hydrolase
VTQRRILLVSVLLPVVLVLLACIGGPASSGLVARSTARWACPSPTPKPYGEAGPIKAREQCNCSTDPATGQETCDTCNVYFAQWEQEYDALGGPPFPAPTPYGRTGTSFRLGERVEIAPLHALVTAEAGAAVMEPGVEAGTQQLYRITIEWTNPTSSSIPIDYSTHLRLSQVEGTNGGLLTDANWGTSAEARRLAELESLPTIIARGTSRVVVPVIAPPGKPKSVALALPVGSSIASGDPFVITGPPSLSAAQIDAILAAEGSPAAGTGQLWYDLGVQYGIDPVFALAFYKKESSMGRDRVHQRGGGNSHNIGNIICTQGWGDCVCTRTHCFRAYPTWADGIADWFRLMRTRYVDQGLVTLDEILPVYAPSFENDTQLYIQQTKQRVTSWRGAGTVTDTDLADDDRQSVTIQWTAGELAGPACGHPGVLTDWASGQGNPIAVAAPPGADRVVQIALGQVGKPYVWGAKGPNSFDCSGLMTWSYAQIGLSIPQGTAGQWPLMQSVARNQLKAGDLVFMDTNDPVRGEITHVGMLVGDLNGNGEWDMVHAASPALGVRVDYDIFSSPYYAGRILGFRTAR